MSVLEEKLAVVNDGEECHFKEIQVCAKADRDGTPREIVIVSNSHGIKFQKFLDNHMEENL